jgi:hypothetical protein
MIPKFDGKGNLPVGIHLATWKEITERYGSNPTRKKLLKGLKAALDSLKSAGCKRTYLDGSFITNKENPGDYELCWEPKGVDRDELDPLFILAVHVLPPRLAQKRKYLGEILLTVPNPAVFDHLSYFQQDDRTGDTKGIIAINMDDLP